MLKPATSVAALAAMLLAPQGVFAFEGRYVGGDSAYRQELTIKKRAGGGFDVTAVVGTEGCTGLVEARGGAAGDALKAKATFDGGICVLSLRRTKSGVTMQTENCDFFHGAACDFDGAYRRRR